MAPDSCTALLAMTMIRYNILTTLSRCDRTARYSNRKLRPLARVLQSAAPTPFQLKPDHITLSSSVQMFWSFCIFLLW